MLGIRKGNKHSYRDFDVTIKSKSIGSPKKNKIKETIPFMNGSYDFSSIYGSQTYGERSIQYVFNIVGQTKTHLNIKKIDFLNWLHKGGKEPLYDDSIPGYYFLAECEDDDFKENGNTGELTVSFTAYPFKIRECYEGNNLWDDFNFELDVLQDTKFTVNGSSNVNIYNSSAIDIEPTIITSSNFEIIKDNKKYVVESGESKDYRFKLKKGNNNITLKGNGTIEFRFRKEVL